MFVMYFLSTGCIFYNFPAGLSNKNPTFAATSNASYRAQCIEIRDTLYRASGNVAKYFA